MHCASFVWKICWIFTGVLWAGWETVTPLCAGRKICLLLAWSALLPDFLRTWKVPAVPELLCPPLLQILLLFVYHFVKLSQTLLLYRALVELLHKQLAGLCYFLFSGERVRQRGQSFCLFFPCHHGNPMPSFIFFLFLFF